MEEQSKSYKRPYFLKLILNIYFQIPVLFCKRDSESKQNVDKEVSDKVELTPKQIEPMQKLSPSSISIAFRKGNEGPAEISQCVHMSV